jgi:WD40 repeat protein
MDKQPITSMGCHQPLPPPPAQQPRTDASIAYSAAFSPDGHMLTVGGDGGTIRLWDVTNPTHPRLLSQPLTGGAGPVGSLDYSHDGRMPASSNLDGTIRLWNLDVNYAIERICATAGGLTPQQWSQYIPQLPYKSSCA